MKQTAVNWLSKRTFIPLYLLEQVKTMEKEQIIDAYCQGVTDIIKDENIFPAETSEEYYNKNYLKEEL